MIKEIRASEIYPLLRGNLRSRPDLGLRKAVAGRVLEPANPFQPQAVRLPQRWFVLFCLLAVLMAASLVYFNLFAASQAPSDPAQVDRFELEAGH